jgi:hypothetical protein
MSFSRGSKKRTEQRRSLACAELIWAPFAVLTDPLSASRIRLQKVGGPDKGSGETARHLKPAGKGPRESQRQLFICKETVGALPFFWANPPAL